MPFIWLLYFLISYNVDAIWVNIVSPGPDTKISIGITPKMSLNGNLLILSPPAIKIELG